MLLDLDIRRSGADEESSARRKRIEEGIAVSFEGSYQRWYTESRAVVKQLLPDRLEEFDQLYYGDGRRKGISLTTFNIQDWLNGVRSGLDAFGEKAFDDFSAMCMRLQTQLNIFESIATRFDSTLFEIKLLVQADLYDSELDSARELASCGFIRAAGVVAGVVLEGHLSQVMENHGVTTRKRATISNLNDCLKDAGVLDVPSWRQIQRLSDIRNICGHDKGRDPTDEEVEELIAGVEKYTKSLF